ncbi:MAG: hypothetical protein HQK76_04630 [Desulfobacterales bacterium]|nr:hypothetical protein [Desulfobacterales bacterium]
MFNQLKFIVVEDKYTDLDEILDLLADTGFLPENKIGTPGTYEEAKSLIEENSNKLDVLFLDLNIPRNDYDGRPEKGHGHALLKLVHNDLNRRSNVHIKVIVISGEELFDGVQDDLLKQQYKDTLAGIVQKANLPKMLKSSLKRLKKDPLRSRIQRNNLDNILEYYDTIFDPAQPIKERLKCSRSLAIRLLQNEFDYQHQQLGSFPEYADDLNGLIKNSIENRFHPDQRGTRRIKMSSIMSSGGWGGFLWRGTMIEHFYTLNNYRNAFEHIYEQPYRNPKADDAWEIPQDVLERLELGERIGKILELIIRDILEWYLPWHERVYMTWLKNK